MPSSTSFRDGNKRVAFVAAVTFLGLNGQDVVAAEKDVVETMRALAASDFDDQQPADWLRARVRPRR